MINPETLDLSLLPSLPIEEKSHFPRVACVYFVIDGEEQIQYIGRSINLFLRWKNHHRINQVERCKDARVAWLKVEDPFSLSKVESVLIEFFLHLLNNSPIDHEKNRKNKKAGDESCAETRSKKLTVQLTPTGWTGVNKRASEMGVSVAEIFERFGKGADFVGDDIPIDEKAILNHLKTMSNESLKRIGYLAIKLLYERSKDFLGLESEE